MQHRYELSGFQSPAAEYARPPLSLDAKFIKRPVSTFFIRFVGDAMEADGILDGDLLVIERVLHFPPGSYVLAFVDGQRVVRQFIQRGYDFLLVSPSPYLPDIEVTDSVELFGVVICSITTFPRTKTEAETAI